MKTVWCTKYCLTGPITEHEVIDDDSMLSGMVTVKWPGGLNGRNYLHANDWHRDKESAMERFNVMVDAKLASLRKSIKKIERLEDSGPTFKACQASAPIA